MEKRPWTGATASFRICSNWILQSLYFYEIVIGSLFHRQNLSPLPLPAQVRSHFSVHESFESNVLNCVDKASSACAFSLEQVHKLHRPCKWSWPQTWLFVKGRVPFNQSQLANIGDAISWSGKSVSFKDDERSTRSFFSFYLRMVATEIGKSIRSWSGN